MTFSYQVTPQGLVKTLIRLGTGVSLNHGLRTPLLLWAQTRLPSAPSTASKESLAAAPPNPTPSQVILFILVANSLSLPAGILRVQ